MSIMGLAENLLNIAGAVGAVVFFIGMVLVPVWWALDTLASRRRRNAPSFHDRYAANLGKAHRKVQERQLAEMDQAGPVLWQPPSRSRKN